MTEMAELQTSDAGVTTLSVPFGVNRLIFETGRLAKQANATIVAQVGGTVALVSVVAAKEPREGIDFFPLMVDYREKFYSAGRIPGGFFKREGRPGTGETLRARLIDRPLRPLFPDGFRNEVQVYVNVLSYDGQNPAELAAMNAASLALGISDVPFAGPLAAVRIGLVEDEFIVNPTIEQQSMSDLDLVVAGTKNAVTMVESGANELPEDVMLEALEFAHENIIELCKAQELMIEKIGKEKHPFTAPEFDQALAKKVKTAAKKPLADAYKIHDKQKQNEAFAEAKKAVVEKVVDEKADNADELKAQAKALFDKEEQEYLREQTLKGTRCDGRKHEEIRPISIELGVLPRTHGSAIFTRGQTQSLGICTLGTPDDEQMIDDINGLSYQRFYLHYNFPSFSVGEVRPPRGPGRREIGHGALAERALLPLVPKGDDFPYTVRIVSEILESNGSSSMATVCSGSLAMFDAGVKMPRPVAGIAMGLVIEGDKFAILSDITGTEDHLGDMDFKVAGTMEGITALQMDIKTEGITLEIMRKALEQALEGRKHILGKMIEALPEPRAEMSRWAPAIRQIVIDPGKIKDIIGPGGKVINAMQEDTGAKINVENDGTVTIASADQGALNEVLRRIEMLTAEAEVGKTYSGKVVNITNFGAFVEFLPGRDGLLHISEIAHGHVRKVEDVLQLGDEVDVKCIAIDPSGKVRLSRRALLEPEEGNGERSGGGGERGGGRGRDRDRGDRGDREERGGRGRDRDRGDRDRGDREERGGRGRDRDRDRDRDRGERVGAEAGVPRGGKRRHEDDEDIPPYRRGAAKDADVEADDFEEDFDDEIFELEDDFEEDEEGVEIEFNAPGNIRSEDQGGGGRGGRGRRRGGGGGGGGGGGRGGRGRRRGGGGGGGGRR